jgi:MYXO-CTERM domain-containing protein
MRTRHTLSVVFGSAMMLAATTAVADTALPPDAIKADPKLTYAAQVLSVASGHHRGRNDGDMKLRYPGFEQSTVVFSKGHLVVVTMEAVQEPGKAPVQCSCSSYQMMPDGPPKLVTDLKRLTDYSNGERACNHPKAAADENGNIVWGYGSDYNSNRPNTYAGILNERCEHLAAPQMVSVPRDANDGAFDITYQGGGNFTGGYYSDGGGEPGPFPAPGGDYSVAMGLSITPGALLPTLTRTWIKDVVTPTNIGRPTITTVAADRALFCAPKGPNRPSDHIECGLIDTTTGTVVWKAVVAAGDRQKQIYFNQPTVVRLSENKFALSAIESSGQGKQGKNVKGSNLSHLILLERNGDSITVGSEIVGAAAHQTHSSICAGGYGEAGEASIAVFSAAPTGIGRAAMQMVSFDQTSKVFKSDATKDLWPAAWYGDSGHLSNMYGRNPMRQGRDFMRCIGDVPNPGYHVEKGYLPDVKTFFVGTVHGRVPGDEKNSLFLSLVPGQMDKKVLPTNPVPAGEAPVLDPNANAGATDAKAADASGGCGCTTASSSTGGTASLLGLIALGLVISVRRRTR